MRNKTIKHNKKTGEFICKVCHLVKDSYIEMVRHRHYTVKQWKKLDVERVRHIGKRRYYLNMQEVLCRKYEIILLNHKTKREKLDRILDCITFTNLNQKIDTFQRIMKKMDGVWKQWDEMKNTPFIGGASNAEYNILIGKPPKRDYSFITGNNKSKPDYSFLTGNNKKTTRRKKQTLGNNKKDYSALIGKRKVKLM